MAYIKDICANCKCDVAVTRYKDRLLCIYCAQEAERDKRFDAINLPEDTCKK